ncbi:MAG TPA: KEOPS complex subunit Pcc1, partial [Candidatus Methanofastidiosa archaeon]|nr:KEOPS complex subunit Pcc1 [Candidatus Methanofastidiosa archaeon]
AGVSYFVAREHNGGNRALSNLAIIGAMGDKMHLSGFKGPNSTILEDARNVGIIEDGGAYEDILVHGLRFSNDGESALKVANIIDSCASVNRPEVAVEMLAGNMRAFETAMVLYDDYRRRYDAQMDAIMSNWERISKENSQHLAYFVYLSEVEPGFTGVLAEELVLRFTDKPVVVVSKAPYGLKASARSTMRQITETGIDLGRAMSEASSYCGGRGGGHDVAAGASFREDQLEEFKSLTTLGLFSQWRSRLKMRFELVTDGQKESASLASSLAVDNERYGSTTSMAIPQGNKIYIMVTSEDIGTFKNTVDDLIVCLTSIKDLVGTGMDHHDI